MREVVFAVLSTDASPLVRFWLDAGYSIVTKFLPENEARSTKEFRLNFDSGSHQPITLGKGPSGRMSYQSSKLVLIEFCGVDVFEAQSEPVSILHFSNASVSFENKKDPDWLSFLKFMKLSLVKYRTKSGIPKSLWAGTGAIEWAKGPHNYIYLDYDSAPCSGIACQIRNYRILDHMGKVIRLF